MKRIVAILALSVSFLFASINLGSASKEELMAIKGIGSKKADKIIEFRKTHKIKTADDLTQIKGFGPKLISNIKKEIKVLSLKEDKIPKK